MTFLTPRPVPVDVSVKPHPSACAPCTNSVTCSVYMPAVCTAGVPREAIVGPRRGIGRHIGREEEEGTTLEEEGALCAEVSLSSS